MPMESSDFYDKFASAYQDYASERRAYIDAVDAFIRSEIGKMRGGSVVDIGSGTGARIESIFGTTKNPLRITAIDNSDGMIGILQKVPGVTITKNDIASVNFSIPEKYDVALCLWNVLGHIATAEKRTRALKNMAKILHDNGRLFIDVNNRYNAAQYGVFPVLKNMASDALQIHPATTGNFRLTVAVHEETIDTTVHLFTAAEMRALIQSAGLKILRSKAIHYRTGKTVLCSSMGQLVYELAKQ